MKKLKRFEKCLLLGALLSMSTVSVMAADMPSAPMVGDAPTASTPAPSDKQASFNQLVSQIQSNDNAPQAAMPPPPPPPVDNSDMVNRQAFKNLLHTIMPLSPNQIQSLRHSYDQSQRAASVAPSGVPAQATSTSLQYDLSPGATPPVVRLKTGYVSSLVFLDSTGQPWPIQSYEIGDSADYSPSVSNNSSQNNTLLIQTKAPYKSTNIVVMLQGLHTPVMLEFLPGQKVYDARLDVRVPGSGPNAKSDFQNLPSTGSASLLNILDGVPPHGAKVLKVPVDDNGHASLMQAWLLNGEMFVRTRATLLSPGWITTMSSADGMHAYELARSPNLLLMQNGSVTNANIEGF